MPSPKYTGSPSGAGNPPGHYSKGYLRDPKGMYGGKGHFVSNKSYRGDMHVGGIMETPPVVGNQPQERKSRSLEASANKENPIPSAMKNYK